MEEKIFTKVDGRAYAEAGIACGELTPVVAVKFARVAARRGEVGEEVISYSQNGIVEKIDTVKADPETGEVDWVLTKLDENGEVVVDEFGHANEWIVKHATFTKKYDLDETKEGSVYKPKGGPQVFVPIVMDVILEQWGSEMKIAAGGYINITNVDDMYAISERDFNDTYKNTGKKVSVKTLR
jgi:hypothetical protein